MLSQREPIAKMSLFLAPVMFVLQVHKAVQ